MVTAQEKMTIISGVALQAAAMQEILATDVEKSASAVFADLVDSVESMQAQVKPLLVAMVEARAKKDTPALVQAHQQLFLICDAVAVTASAMVSHFPGYSEELLTPEIRAAWQLDTLKT